MDFLRGGMGTEVDGGSRRETASETLGALGLITVSEVAKLVDNGGTRLHSALATNQPPAVCYPHPCRLLGEARTVGLEGVRKTDDVE